MSPLEYALLGKHSEKKNMEIRSANVPWPIRKNENTRQLESDIKLESDITGNYAIQTLVMIRPFTELSTAIQKITRPLHEEQPTDVFNAANGDPYRMERQDNDWSQGQRVCVEYRIILSGGITPENASEALHILRPYGLDVSSGGEESPGVKSIEKVKALLQAVENPFA